MFAGYNWIELRKADWRNLLGGKLMIMGSSFWNKLSCLRRAVGFNWIRKEMFELRNDWRKHPVQSY
jgi:hypothetical protein